jgi:hypothetical protein
MRREAAVAVVVAAAAAVVVVPGRALARVVVPERVLARAVLPEGALLPQRPILEARPEGAPTLLWVIRTPVRTPTAMRAARMKEIKIVHPVAAEDAMQANAAGSDHQAAFFLAGGDGGRKPPELPL